MPIVLIFYGFLDSLYLIAGLLNLRIEVGGQFLQGLRNVGHDAFFRTIQFARDFANPLSVFLKRLVEPL